MQGDDRIKNAANFVVMPGGGTVPFRVPAGALD
jgi:hypothetical protein